MKNEINFYFDEHDEFCCRVNMEYEINDYVGFEAIRVLEETDVLDFDHLNVDSRMITLSNEDTIVTIEDLSKFFQKDYISYLNNTLKSINEAVANYQKRKRKKHIVTNLKVQGSRVLASSLVLALLSCAPSLLNKSTKEDNNDNTTNLEQDFIDEMPNIETPKIVTQSIDSMLEELDKLDENYPGMIKDGFEEDWEEFQEKVNSIPENPINVAYLVCDDKTNSEKFEHAYNGYYDIVEKYCDKWGAPDNVIMAMLTQESGGYVPDNLMQIVFKSWIDQKITEYDFVNNRYQSIVLTDEPEKWAGKNVTIITRDDLKNKVTNISVGCVIFRYCLEQLDYNIPLAIQAYNQGCGGVKMVLAETSKQTGIPYDDLLRDPTNVEFMNYTNTIDWGDPEYLNHVSMYIENSNDITVKVIDDNGEISEITISIARKKL